MSRPRLLHPPDTHRTGKLAAKPPHVMLAELLDVEKAHATFAPLANIINSCVIQGGPAMGIGLGMYLNDREGDCTCAGVANTLRVNSSGTLQLSDDDVQAAYVAVTGQEGGAYDPATGANDNGCAEIDVLDHWVKVGVGSDRLIGHAGVNVADETELRTALYLTGSIYPGWALSTDQQSQPVWGPGSAQPGSWGGHCAPIFDWWTEIPAGLQIGGVAIDPHLGEVLTVGTWGAYKPCLGGPKGFVAFCCDEAHALITAPFLARAKAFGLIDQPKLEAYLSSLQPES